MSRRWLSGVEALLQTLGIDLQPKQVVLIYGQPMVGKSVLSALIAKWWALKRDSNVVIVGLETAYGEEDYVNFISKFLEGAKFNILMYDDVQKAVSVLSTGRYISAVHGAGVVVIDSVSALADAIAGQVVEKTGSLEPRVIAARVSPILRLIVRALRDVVVRRGGLGIVVAHAGSTAGTSKYRGIVDWRPSLATRCAHYISYELLLEIYEKKRDYRRVTVVAARNRPWIEGNSTLFRFRENDIEVLAKSGEEEG